MPVPSPETYAAICHTFAAFLTVAIHTILYERGIYPESTFLTARAYNYPVRQSRHPLVCQWINDAVLAVENELLKRAVARVAIVIFEAEGKGRPLERFVFDLSRWPEVPAGEVYTPIVRDTGNAVDTKITVDMEEQLRGVMSKLAVCGKTLKPVPENCTYTVCIELKDEVDPPIGHPQPWIPAQPTTQNTITTRGNLAFGGELRSELKKGEDVGGVNTVPLRAVDADEMIFEMWIEEGKAKMEPQNGTGSTSTFASLSDT
jgi:mitotic spindle assembly checkpoint protein MAD2B